MQTVSALAACERLVDLRRQLDEAIVQRDLALRAMHYEAGIPSTRVATALLEEIELAGTFSKEDVRVMGISKHNVRLAFDRPSPEVLAAEARDN